MKNKKYYKSKGEALKAKDERTRCGAYGIGVFKMPKGSKKADMYAVCTELEYLNTY